MEQRSLTPGRLRRRLHGTLSSSCTAAGARASLSPRRRSLPWEASSTQSVTSSRVGPSKFLILVSPILVMFLVERIPRADGFFKPRVPLKAPPPGPKKSNLPSAPRSPNPVINIVGPRKPWFVMAGEADGSSSEQFGTGSQEEVDLEEGEEDEDGDRVSVPEIEVPEMMDVEERARLWVAVARAENDVARLTRAGKLEEAEAMRAHVDALKHEDPYTALQEQLDEAVQKEEFVRIARLRLQMRKIGVPPNAEMQAKAEGRDPSSIKAETARQMPGMSGRESDGGRRSESKNDGSTVSDGYSSKSVTTTNGVRVEVRSQYYPEQSNPLKDQYIFVYKVKITNNSKQTVQLVSRTWEIKAVEASEAPQLVKGPGVVGQQPVLEPGQSFEYSSACPITCAPKEGYQVLGRMKGSYLIVMGAVGEAAFEAQIDPFYLILPQAVLDERAGGGGGGGGGGAVGGGDMAGSW